MYYRFFKVRRRDIYLIKKLLDGYENMMDVATVDRERGKIQILIAPDFKKDCEAILADLQQRFLMMPLNDPTNKSQANY